MLNGWMSVLLAHMVRCDKTIEMCSGRITHSDLTEYTGDSAVGYIWALSSSYFEKYGRPVPRQFMLAEMTEFANDTGMMPADVVGLDEFVSWIYDADINDFNYEEAAEYVKRFLNETRVTQPLQDGLRDGVPIDELFLSFQDGLNAAAVGALQVIDPLGDYEAALGGTKPTVLGGTDVKYFNMAVNGGLCPGEIAVLMGPMGGFKTTMMVDVLCSMAQTGMPSMFRAHEQSYKAGDLPVRFMSRFTGIPRSVLGETDITGISAEMHEKIRAAKKYSALVMFQDRTTHPDYIADIAADVQQLASEGRKPELIVIDQLLTWVQKWEGVDKDESAMRKIIGKVVLELKTRVCEKFGTRAILVHQIAAASIGKYGGQSFHHTESAECKSVGYWADFVLTIGTPSEDGVLKLVGSKTRRGPGTEVLVKTIPETCEFRVASDYEEARYQPGTYVKKGEANVMPDAKLTSSAELI